MIPNWPLHFLSYIKIFFLDSIDNFYEILTWTIYLNTTQCLWSITWYKYGLTVFKIVSLIQWLTFIHNNYCSGLCLAPFWINSEAFDGIVLNSTTLPVIFVFNTCIIVVRGSVKRFCLFDWWPRLGAAWSGGQARPWACLVVGWSRVMARGRRSNMVLVELELKHSNECRPACWICSWTCFPVRHSDHICVTRATSTIKLCL